MDLAFKTLSELKSSKAFDEAVDLYIQRWEPVIKWEYLCPNPRDQVAENLRTCVDNAPHTQIVAMHNGHVVASIHGRRIDENFLRVATLVHDSYSTITDDMTFETDSKDGDALVCVAIQVAPGLGGKGVGSRLIDAVTNGFGKRIAGRTTPHVKDAEFSDTILEAFDDVDVERIFPYSRINQYREFMRHTGEYIEPEDYAGFFEQLRDNSVFRVTAEMDGIVDILKRDASYFHIVKNRAEWVTLCKYARPSDHDSMGHCNLAVYELEKK